MELFDGDELNAAIVCLAVGGGVAGNGLGIAEAFGG